jgi:predicted DNA binding CopG/RHH family protein
MNKKRNIFDIKLDDEEKELLESAERGEWKSVDNLAEEIAKAKAAATNFLRKNARVNIRMSNSDLDRLKRLAAYEGLPYQTLIASVLHKYAAGHLDVDRL